MTNICPPREIKRFTDQCKELLKGPLTLEAIYKHALSHYAQNKAIIYFDEDEKIRSYSYKEYAEHVAYLAPHVAGALSGVPKGAPVAFKMRNSPNWPLLFWAILMSGHPILLINASLEKANTENLIAQAGAKAIIANEESEYSVPSFRLNEIRGSEEPHNYEPTWADEVMFCSSGTTGEAKIVVMKGASFCNQCIASIELYKQSSLIIHPGRIRLLAMLPFHHIFGFNINFIFFTFYGKTLVFPMGSSSSDILLTIRKAKCTHIFSVPMFWDAIAQKAERQAALGGEKKAKIFADVIAYNNGEISKSEAGPAAWKTTLRHIKKKVFGGSIVLCVSGGGYLTKKTSRLINGLGYPLANGYGMSEIGITSVEASMDTSVMTLCSIGLPFYGVSYKIVPHDGHSQEGELYIKSSMLHETLIVGGKPEAPSLDEEGYYATGDIASMDETGRCYIKGRIKDTIISSNGENVYPDEIESYFKNIPLIDNLCVLGLPEESGKERIVLVCQLNNSVKREELASIKSKIDGVNASMQNEKRLTDILLYKKPLPLAGNMKVKRVTLRQELKTNPQNFISFDGKGLQPHGRRDYPEEILAPVLEKVKSVFSAVLFLPDYKIGDEDVWTDLGGDSMSYVGMVSELNDSFQIEIPTEKYGTLANALDFACEVIRLKGERFEKEAKKSKAARSGKNKAEKGS